MKCPTGAGKLESRRNETLGVEWDVCDTCHGVWFDDVELGKAAKYFATKLVGRERTKIVRVADSGRHVPPLLHPCPRDGSAMESFVYAGDSGIVVDRCQTCLGIWLDGGELEKVQEYLRPDATADALSRAVVVEIRDLEKIKIDIARMPTEMALAVSNPYFLVRFLVNVARDLVTKGLGGD